MELKANVGDTVYLYGWKRSEVISIEITKCGTNYKVEDLVGKRTVIVCADDFSMSNQRFEPGDYFVLSSQVEKTGGPEYPYTSYAYVVERCEDGIVYPRNRSWTMIDY